MFRVIVFFIAGLLLMGSARSLPAAAQPGSVLTVVAHDSFIYTQAVMEAFTERTGVAVEVLRLGDAGNLVNQSILSRENPLGDVMFGVDNTFLSRALEADLFVPYESTALETIDLAFVLDDQHRVTPVTVGDICLNYDVAYFADSDLPVPDDLRDLTNPAYRELLAMPNPALSSPGLAFLLLTVAVFGEVGDYTYLDYWRDLAVNQPYIAPDWTAAYYGAFRGADGGIGSHPLVVSYASSPPAEVFFAVEPLETAPTAAITEPRMCFRQIEFAGILHGTDNLATARQFIDFLIGREFQEDMPLNMFVFPVNEEAMLPPVFEEHAVLPAEPVTMDIERIDAGREIWIEAWTEVMLR